MKVYRIVSIISILVLTSLTTFSQDTIVRTNGTKISARILEADSLQISYYKYSDPEQRLFFLSTEYVSSINYKDGKVKNYSSLSLIDDYTYKPLKKNILSFSLLDLAFGGIAIRYEKLQGSGKVGLFAGGMVNLLPKAVEHSINAYYGYDDLHDYGYSLARSYGYLETGVNFYSLNWGSLTVGTGTSFLLALYKTEETSGYDDPYPEPGVELAFKWMWVNQIRIELSESINIFIEGDLSFAPRFFGTSIAHLGFTASF